jgi:DNA-binding PadR family transcriptional regulator
MDLMGELLRGHTDAIILSILEINDSYGYQINKEIDMISDHRFILTEATLYTTFKRLENAGYIVSYWKEGTNNVRRRYYSITETGRQYLSEQRKSWQAAETIINQFLKNLKT